MPDQKGFSLTATPNVVNVIANNLGVTFSPQSLASLQAGTTVLAGRGALTTPGGFVHKGCITKLYYQDDSTDLRHILVDGKFYDPTNLKDFREALEQAACCGHSVAFCVRGDNTMVMLHVYPCECKCDKRG